MQQLEIQVGKRIVVTDPGQPWHGATGSVHSQTAPQVGQGVCIVLLDRPLNAYGQLAQALSLPITSLAAEPITNRVVAEGGIPIELTMTFKVEYNVNPAYYRSNDARAILAEEIRAARKDPKFPLSQPVVVLTVEGKLASDKDAPPAPQAQIVQVDVPATPVPSVPPFPIDLPAPAVTNATPVVPDEGSGPVG